MEDNANGDAPGDLKRTPLDDLHIANGGRLVGFAGYDMPVQYKAGILKEHLHTRAAAGLFDVSHMGQLVISTPDGDVRKAALALEKLVPADIAGLGIGRQRYTYFTNDAGGILDDLMVANLGDRLSLVVNAATKEADEAHLRANLPGSIKVERLERALIALQGPKAEAALARLAPDCAAMRFMDVRELDIDGEVCTVSRSGYTGEDGYEISVPVAIAEPLAKALLEMEEVEPIGLGARDSLRLEAGLCLYGSDIDDTTTPVEAALMWAVQKVRREGGDRAGGYPGADVVAAQLKDGPDRLRVGLKPLGRAPVRGGASIYATESGGEAVGVVTSGGFGPSFGGPVAMGYVPAKLAEAGNGLFAEVRGKRLGVETCKLPFVEPGYRRN
ncbi:MAG: glycine cleavage system aminomethyltransferase GcvT [Alphaproteobacteria bacterium]|nr:glycine cleavage system aminomethyltransferase GcvT [Alphaproteobacteria bacterium]